PHTQNRRVGHPDHTRLTHLKAVSLDFHFCRELFGELCVSLCRSAKHRRPETQPAAGWRAKRVLLGVVMSSSGNGLTNGKAAKKRRRRIIIGSMAALIVIGGGYGVFAALRPNHEIDPSKLATAERGDLARVVVATGKIQPLSKVEVKSKASGMVKKLYVDYDDSVKQGQVLCELDKVQLEAVVREAHANFQAAQAARDSAVAAMERNKVDAEGPDVPFLKLSMERAEQMYKDGVMAKSVVEDAEKNYQLALNKQM